MLATLSGECRCVQELLPHPILAFVAGFLDVRRPCLRRRQTLGAVGRAILFPWRLYQFITRARLILLVVAWFTWLGSVPSLFLESTYFHFFRSPRIDENSLVFHSSHYVHPSLKPWPGTTENRLSSDILALQSLDVRFGCSSGRIEHGSEDHTALK